MATTTQVAALNKVFFLDSPNYIFLFLGLIYIDEMTLMAAVPNHCNSQRDQINNNGI
jgi:hypothetical protein